MGGWGFLNLVAHGVFWVCAPGPGIIEGQL